jgi:hypothetical protein
MSPYLNRPLRSEEQARKDIEATRKAREADVARQPGNRVSTPLQG